MNDIRRVSVIIVVKNGKDVISKAIESVLNQSYKNIEIVIVDGNSNDGTTDIISSYGNKIHKFLSEPDKNIADALNKGVRLSTSEYISFLDCDNVWNNDTIEKLMEPINRLNDIVLVYSDFNYINIQNGQDKYFQTDINMMPNRMGVCPCSMVVNKTAFWHCGGYPTNRQLAGDYEFFLNLFFKYKANQFFHIPESLIKFYSGGVSDKKWVENYYEVAQIKIKYGKSKVRAFSEFLYYLMRTGFKKQILNRIL